MHKTDDLRAIGLVSIGFFFYSIGDTLFKNITNFYPPIQLMYMIGISSVTMLVTYGLIKGGRKAFWTKHPKIHMFRASCGTLNGIVNLIAFKTIQLDVFYAVVFTAPFWVAILGRVLLKDKIGFHRGGAILFGFIVLLFMVRPDGALFSIGALLTLIGTFLFAVSATSVRFLDKDENKIWFMLAGPLGSLVLLFPILFFIDGFVMPEPIHIVFCIMGSVVFILGSFCTSKAFHSVSSSSIIAPFQYTQMIWGIMLGYLVFGDTPTQEVLIGSALLALSGLYLVRYEKRQSKMKLKISDPAL